MNISAAFQVLTPIFSSEPRVSASSGTIGTTGTYKAMVQTLTTPLDQVYTTDSGAGLVTYGDLTYAQQAADCWLVTDTAAAYATLARSAAGVKAGVSLRGGLLHVLQNGAEFAGAPGRAGDLFVTGGTTAVASQAMTGSTLITFATCNTVAVTGDNNDIFSFGVRDAISATGTGNTFYGGPGAASFQISGHVNTFRGGEGCSTVTLTGSDAAANIVIGGAGSLTLNSTAPVTQFIGGPGDAILNLVGDYSSVLLGDGTVCGHVGGNGVAIETGAGSATLDVTSGGGDVIVTGSGAACVTFTGSGATLLQGDAGGHALFTVTGTGVTVYGGDVVTMNGTGLEVRSRAEGLTGSAGSSFVGVLNAMGSFATDPVIASAIAADTPYFAPQMPGFTNGASSASSSSSSSCSSTVTCCPSAGLRVVNLNTTNSAVYGDTRYDLVTINGSNNNAYGGAAGRTVVIASGTRNAIWGSAGSNTYIGDGQQNVLEYITLPTATTAPGAVTVNLGLGLAVNAYGGLDRICGINWVEAGSGSVLIGGAADATLTVIGDNGTLRGGCGNDTLTATGSGNTLQTSYGNDLLHTGGQNNVYQLGSGCSAPGAVEIRQDWAGITGSLQFLTPTAPSQLWFNQDAAGDLVIHVLGSREVVTVDNWFGPQATQLASISTPCGTISNAGINALEAAMVKYQSTHAGFDPNTATRMPSDPALAGAFAAAWHGS